MTQAFLVVAYDSSCKAKDKSTYGAFTFQIKESKFEIKIIDSVYFAKIKSRMRIEIEIVEPTLI